MRCEVRVAGYEYSGVQVFGSSFAHACADRVHYSFSACESSSIGARRIIVQVFGYRVLGSYQLSEVRSASG